MTVEWTHGLAPKAKILVVEAKSEASDDMFVAVDRATHELTNNGGGELVMPWVIPETEIQQDALKRYEPIFQEGITYFAATGDSTGLMAYPASSARVVAVGGTVLVTDRKTGTIVDEIGWPESGGGKSRLISQPAFQKTIAMSNMRMVPDIAVNATSVRYYNGSPCAPFSPGLQYGKGTSLAVVIAAAMANSAGNHNHSSTAELGNIYAHFGDIKSFKDITSCGLTPCPAASGYDTVTGVGAPRSISFDAAPVSH